MNLRTGNDFENWLADMDLALERFIGSLPATVGEQLDFSERSLEVLEAWLLEKYGSIQAMLAPSEIKTVDALGRYIVETFRKVIGGHWEIRNDDPSYVFHGVPQLTGFWSNPTPVCPMALATASADRRNGRFLAGVMTSYQEQKARKA